jgi:hypothetical protein
MKEVDGECLFYQPTNIQQGATRTSAVPLAVVVVVIVVVVIRGACSVAWLSEVLPTTSHFHHPFKAAQ